MTEITIINLTITIYAWYISWYIDSWRYISIFSSESIDIYRYITLGGNRFVRMTIYLYVIFIVMKVFLSLVSTRFNSLSKLPSSPMMSLSGHDEGEVFRFGVFWGFERGWSLRGRGTIDDKLWWVKEGVNQASSNVVEWALESVLVVK